VSRLPARYLGSVTASIQRVPVLIADTADLAIIDDLVEVQALHSS